MPEFSWAVNGSYCNIRAYQNFTILNFKKVKISFEIGADISSIICIGFLVAYKITFD